MSLCKMPLWTVIINHTNNINNINYNRICHSIGNIFVWNYQMKITKALAAPAPEAIEAIDDDVAMSEKVPASNSIIIPKRPESLTKSCKNNIIFKLPENKSVGNLELFTCDKNGPVVNDVPANPRSIYKFIGGSDCAYEKGVFNMDELIWYKNNVHHIDNCQNFSYAEPHQRIYNRVSQTNPDAHLDDIQKLNLPEDKTFKYFTCGTDGGGYEPKPWHVYEYDNMGDGTYYRYDETEWYKNNVSHVKDCSGLIFYKPYMPSSDDENIPNVASP